MKGTDKRIEADLCMLNKKIKLAAEVADIFGAWIAN